MAQAWSCADLSALGITSELHFASRINVSQCSACCEVSGFVNLRQMAISDRSKSTAPSPQRAWYSDSIAGFLRAEPLAIFAQLANNRDFDLLSTQKD